MTRNAALLLLAASAAAAAAAAADHSAVPATAGPVPKVQVGAQAVAGLSAGAFFAVQYQVAYSSELIGAGVVAGGPFYCAQGEEWTATGACMRYPSLVDNAKCVAAAKDCASSGACDPVSGLAKQRSWLYSGTKDTVVHQGVMQKLQEFYGSFMPASSVNTTFTLPSEHSWVTNNYGSECATLGEPYINNCGFEASDAMMSFLTARTLRAPAAAANQSSFYAVDQSKYTPGGVSPASLSLGPTAYVYVPEACRAGAPCLLVTVAHGCEQTLSDIGGDFIHHIGMNELAETNNFVVLYPQAIRSLFPGPLNPMGCFDWWGYTTTDYANQRGPQMATVHAMTQAIVNGTA